MFEQRKDLFELKIVHSLPGRIRLNCKAIGYLKDFNEQILKDIIDLGFVKKVSINNLTKNILINFDSSRIDEVDLMNLISEVLIPIPNNRPIPLNIRKKGKNIFKAEIPKAPTP